MLKFNSFSKGLYLGLVTVSITFTTVLIGCRKESLVIEKATLDKITTAVGKTAIEMTAHNVLKSKMSVDGFGELDWSKATILRSNNEPVVMKIPSGRQANKFLMFGNLNNTQSYNWVEIRQNKAMHSARFSGELILTSIDNTILNDVTIMDGKAVVSEQGKKVSVNSISPAPIKQLNDFCSGCTIPDVTVSGYYSSLNYTMSSGDWWSLYWLFNMNSSYSYQYTGSYTGPTGGVLTDIANLPSLLSLVDRKPTIVQNPDGTVTITAVFPGALFFNGIYAKATVTFTILPQAQANPTNFSISISPSLTVGVYSFLGLDLKTVLYNSNLPQITPPNTLFFSFAMNYYTPLLNIPFTLGIPETWNISVNYNAYPYVISLSK